MTDLEYIAKSIHDSIEWGGKSDDYMWEHEPQGIRTHYGILAIVALKALQQRRPAASAIVESILEPYREKKDATETPTAD